MNNLCKPCTPVEIAKKIREESKSLKYKVMESNMNDLIENEYYRKNCIPNFYELMGNDDSRTATDRFNKDAYDKLVNSIPEAFKKQAPELEDIDETIDD